MSIVFLMVPMALLLGFGFFAAFYWAVSRGQFDDLETPALRILEDPPQERKQHGKKHSQV